MSEGAEAERDILTNNGIPSWRVSRSGGGGLVIKQWGEGRCTVVVIVVAHYLWWWLGISKKTGEGRGDVLSSSLPIVTCGGSWGLVKKWGRGGGRSVVIVAGCYLGWWLGIRKKTGEGREDVLSLSLCVVTCGGGWEL